MSWNISKPGDYINGPLTVVGVATFNTNVGIGVTPEAWTAFNPVLRIKNATTGGGGALGSTGIDNFRMLTNVFYDGQYKRIGAGYATVYEQASGQHVWYIDGSGAAGSVFTPTASMILSSAGLGVGGISPELKFRVNGPDEAPATSGISTTNGALRIGGANTNLCIDSGVCTSGGIYGWLQSRDRSTYASNYDLVLQKNGGNVGIGVVPVGGKGCLQISSGINFPATQVASTDPNTLDDYEEGTWTPVVADANTGGNTGTCTINSAKYTKIGRVVSVECDISGITTTGMTAGNGFNIRGLPFVPVNGANGSFYTYRVGRNASTVSSSVYAPGSVTALQFYLYTASSGTADLRILVSDIVSTTSQIIVSVTYTV